LPPICSWELQSALTREFTAKSEIRGENGDMNIHVDLSVDIIKALFDKEKESECSLFVAFQSLVWSYIRKPTLLI
jgi:cyclopropane fatty-acyl-phospholipid synthase-like methyltransferase